MEQGDADVRRERAAALIKRQQLSIEARIHTLLGDDARRLVNTEDVLSTAMRRVDSLILRGAFEERSETHFYALVHGVIERTILEKARASRRLTKREQLAHQLLSQASVDASDDHDCPQRELAKIGEQIRNPIDREIALLRGRDLPFHVIAEMMNMDPNAVRMRWSRMRARIRDQMNKEIQE